LDQLATRLVVAATRVQTPLALAGLIMIVLYAISSQMLHLDIFTNVGGSGTIQILDGLLQKIFILAIVSLFFAFVSYIASLYLRHRLAPKTSNLELIDARLDADSSKYTTATEEDRPNIIRPQQVDRQ
jgi:hypothetical protein